MDENGAMRSQLYSRGTPVRKSRAVPSVDVRRVLIEAALRVLARDGIAASQRSILKESGVLHQSAIQYYFGGKDGLIRAVLADVGLPLRERQLAALDAFASSAPSRDPIRALLRAFATTHFQLLLTERGKDTAQFIARLQSEYGTQGQRFLFEEFGVSVERLVELARIALPKKPLMLLRFHILMAVTNTFHGVVEISILDVAPWEMLRPEPEAEYAVRSAFFDYLTGGVSAEPHRQPRRKSSAAKQRSGKKNTPSKRSPAASTSKRKVRK